METSTVRQRFKNVNGKLENEDTKVPPDNPCHKLRESLFYSSDVINYTGVSYMFPPLMLGINAIFVAENIAKYGLLIIPVQMCKLFFSKLIELPMILTFAGLLLFALFSFGCEVLISKKIIAERFGLSFIGLLLTLEILIPIFAVHFTDSYTVALLIIFCYIPVFLKLISYHMVNYWCRKRYPSTSKTDLRTTLSDQCNQTDTRNSDLNLVQYPDNLIIKDLYYFLFAPTLCYELNFPRLSKIRKPFLVKRVLEVLFLSLFILLLSQQLLLPILFNFQDSLQDVEYARMFEIFIKFSIAIVTISVLFSFLLFHSWLNVIAEILRFGDRYFYGDWWNSKNVLQFYQKWTVPVHRWCTRHLLKPLIKIGYTQIQAASIVFLISAVFHEYFFSVPLKIITMWMFSVYLMHVPLIVFSMKQSSNQLVNVICNVMFCAVMPLMIFPYMNQLAHNVRNTILQNQSLIGENYI